MNADTEAFRDHWGDDLFVVAWAGDDVAGFVLNLFDEADLAAEDRNQAMTLYESTGYRVVSWATTWRRPLLPEETAP